MLTTMMPEYDVIWSGAHGNQDADLVCCSGIPVKRPAPRVSVDPPPRQSLTQIRVSVALEAGPLTMDELVDVTGLTLGAARNALDRLREQTYVEVRARVPKRGSGAAVCVYALTLVAA